MKLKLLSPVLVLAALGVALYSVSALLENRFTSWTQRGKGSEAA